MISPPTKFLPSFHGQHKCHLHSGVPWAFLIIGDHSFFAHSYGLWPLLLELSSLIVLGVFLAAGSLSLNSLWKLSKQVLGRAICPKSTVQMGKKMQRRPWNVRPWRQRGRLKVVPGSGTGHGFPWGMRLLVHLSWIPDFWVADSELFVQEALEYTPVLWHQVPHLEV